MGGVCYGRKGKAEPEGWLDCSQATAVCVSGVMGGAVTERSACTHCLQSSQYALACAGRGNTNIPPLGTKTHSVTSTPQRGASPSPKHTVHPGPRSHRPE